MKWNSHSLLPIRLSAALLLASGLASAGSLLTPTGVNGNLGESIWINEDGTDTQTYFAGVIFIQLQENGEVFDRSTLCVDLFTDIYLDQTYSTVMQHPAALPAKNLERVSYLIEDALFPTMDPSNPTALPQADWVATPAQGAGIQLAIWDIVHDGGDGFSLGRVQAAKNPANPTDPAVLTWAQIYESVSLGQQDNSAFIYTNTDMGTQSSAQMLAGPQFWDGGPYPNPEPSTFLLAGVALILIAQAIRRRRRSSLTEQSREVYSWRMVSEGLAAAARQAGREHPSSAAIGSSSRARL